MPRSVRFALLPEAEQRATWPATAGPFRALASVQLRARHWVIRNAQGDVTGEVRGEAVVGEYPILTPGAPCGMHMCPCAAVFIGMHDTLLSENTSCDLMGMSSCAVQGATNKAERHPVWLCSYAVRLRGAEASSWAGMQLR